MSNQKNQEYLQRVLDKCEPGTKIISEYKNAKSPLNLECVNGHQRQVTTNGVISKGSGIYCKECKGLTSTGKKSDKLVDAELLNSGYKKLEEYNGALVPILVERLDCGHQFKLIPSRVTRGQNIQCPECTLSRRRNTPEEIIKEIEGFGVQVLDTYAGMKTNLQVKNLTCEHVYYINPGHFLYDGIGKICPTCSGLGSTKNRFFTKLLENNLQLVDEYTTTQTPVTLINSSCGHSYKVIPNNLVNADTGIVCRECNPYVHMSKAETEIAEYLKSKYSGWIELSDRSILGGKELDIVLPDLGIAIEYNGVYWHSHEHKAPQYHLDKTKEVEDFGYQLIHIFDYEWLSKKPIVQSRLNSIIGKTTKIYAKHTKVAEIPFPAEFLNQNHIQGAGVATKYNYGLYYENKLVAVMTFGTPRFNNTYDYELIRYCSKLDTTVVGGASKLLKFFRKLMNNCSIVSYSDKRWSKGNLYKQLGFHLSHTSTPNYRYYKYKTSYSRYQCQKHLLEKLVPEYYKKELSETEIMNSAGFSKVYDCGNDVWVLS
jgi:predicted nucleic acid-binding Zn ribbon protein